MGELQEVIKGFNLKNRLQDSESATTNNDKSFNWSGSQSQQQQQQLQQNLVDSSNSQSRRSSYNLPLPPSKTCNSRKSSDTPVETKENLLITLDSSPEDLESMFDPLLQKQKSYLHSNQQQKAPQQRNETQKVFQNPENSILFDSNSNLSNQPLSIQRDLNLLNRTTTINTNQRPQLPPKPPAQSYLYRLPSTIRYDQLPQPSPHLFSSSSNSSSSTSSPYSHSISSSSTSIINPSNSMVTGDSRGSIYPIRPGSTNIGNHSFLHSNSNYNNGALKTRSNAYTNPICNISNTTCNSKLTTNPFTNNNPVQFTSCGKSSTANSIIHPNLESIVATDQNSFNSNWQKFD